MLFKYSIVCIILYLYSKFDISNAACGLYPCPTGSDNSTDWCVVSITEPSPIYYAYMECGAVNNALIDANLWILTDLSSFNSGFNAIKYVMNVLNAMFSLNGMIMTFGSGPSFVIDQMCQCDVSNGGLYYVVNPFGPCLDKNNPHYKPSAC